MTVSPHNDALQVVVITGASDGIGAVALGQLTRHFGANAV